MATKLEEIQVHRYEYSYSQYDRYYAIEGDVTGDGDRFATGPTPDEAYWELLALLDIPIEENPGYRLFD